MLRFTSIWLGLFLCGATITACGKDSLTQLRTKTDAFRQNAAASIDILWVVDNSESMAEEQQGLAESFTEFVATLISSEVNYHIGVISTDVADGGRLHTGSRGVPFIEPDTAEAEATFLENVTVGVDGARDEKGMEAAALALGKGGGWGPNDPVVPPNGGFLRDDAALFIIMVSDEEDNSFGPVSYYARLFESAKAFGNEARVSVSGIVGPAGDTTEEQGCYDAMRGSADPGARYVELADRTGGVVTSICADFNESLSMLSYTAAGLQNVFTLSSWPNLAASIPCGDGDGESGNDIPASFLCVKVNGAPVAEGNNRFGWTYVASSNSIVFGTNTVPHAENKITVEYQVGRR